MRIQNKFLEYAGKYDINITSFSLANNQVSAANITGLLLDTNARAGKAFVSVYIDATTDLYEEFEVTMIRKGSDVDYSVSSLGDESGIALSVTSAGQVQYTSTNIPGFATGTCKFRLTTLPV